MTSTEIERLWEPIGGFLEAEGIELDDLEVGGTAGGRFVRVLVDAPGGIDVERIAEASQGISRMLDDLLVAGGFTLEVSSPGLERSLRRVAHYHKSVGREVQVTTTTDIEGSRDHRGVLESVGDEALSIEIGGASRLIPFDAVSKARTIFTWGAKRGGKGSRR